MSNAGWSARDRPFMPSWRRQPQRPAGTTRPRLLAPDGPEILDLTSDLQYDDLTDGILTPEHHLAIPNARKPMAEARDFSARLVVVNVGKPTKSFHIPEKVLCATSDFLTTALKPLWAEGKRGVIDLLDDEPDMFNLYINWAHDGRLFIDDTSGSMLGMHERLLKLYVLGDKLLDSAFKDAICDAMATTLTSIESPTKVFPVDNLLIDPLYHITPPGCALRRMVVWSHSISGKLEEIVTEELDPTFLRDLVLARDKSLPGFVKAVRGCDFHEHTKAEDCYRTKRAWP